ncbi:F0F1 ATP synthase subunit gamma [Aeromicrobium sp.]|nr:F0F1 ATP synthase subunit gamma [Candidatus Saccharibacteria bacterium]
MKRPSELAHEEASMATLVELTSAFEGIASMKIAQTKNQVLESTKFFDRLWKIYSQMRVDSLFTFGRDVDEKPLIDKELFIMITAEGGFSGDIDQKILKLVLEEYDAEKHDIIVIGHHGAIQLSQRGIGFKKYYKLPAKDQNINVVPIVREVQQYKAASLFYAEYISLMSQDVKKISLASAVKSRAAAGEDDDAEVISEETYIFEPDSFAVAAHLERSMMQISISQLILSSKLAQYASRFKAMTASHQRADESRNDLHMEFNRSRRAIKDQRLKEIITGIKKSTAGAGN